MIPLRILVLNVLSSRNIPLTEAPFLGYMSDYSTYPPEQPGYPQPSLLPRLPPDRDQSPVPPIYPIDGHARAIPQVLEPVVPHLGMGHINRPNRHHPQMYVSQTP